MKKLVYSFANLDAVAEAREDVRARGNMQYKLNVISKDKAGLQNRDIPVPGVLVRTDLARFLQRGAIIGAVTGAIIIAVLLLIGIDWPLGAFIALFLFSLFAGTAGSGFGGITADNIHVRPYTEDLHQGKHLVLIDVPDDRVADIKALMAKHPDATLQGKDDAYINPLEGTDEEPDAEKAAVDNPENQAKPKR